MTRKKNRISKQKQFLSDGEKNENAANEKSKTEEATATPEKVEREYIDIINYQRKQRDNLLGNFATGAYMIPEEIKNELLKVPKKFGEFEENIARVSTILGNYVLNFKVVFTIDPDVCNAKLYFIEIEHDLDEDIKHETFLGEVEQNNTLEFRSLVFEKWHIYYEDESLEKDTLLQNYLHMQHEENLFFGELEMILSQLFVVRLLAYLDKMGELGEKIRIDFKLAMEKYLALDPKYAQNFAFQKRVLDKLIAKHGALLLIAKDAEGTKILLGYSTPLKNVRDRTYPSTVVEPPKKEEKKTEKKAEPTVKKKGGKPAKKADSKAFKFDPSKVPKLGLAGSGGEIRILPIPEARPQQTYVLPENPERLERTINPDAQEHVEKTGGLWSQRVGNATKTTEDIINLEESQPKSDLEVSINQKEELGEQIMPNKNKDKEKKLEPTERLELEF